MSVAFNFNDLVKHGVSDDGTNYDGKQDASRRPRLNVSVHSLWQQKNFRRGVMLDEIDYLPMFGQEGWDDPEGNIPDDLYNRLLPALQLATVFLHRARPFFMKVMFADITPSPQGSVFAHDYYPDPADLTAYDAGLLHVASSYRIYTEASFGGSDRSIFGLTKGTPDPAFPVLGSLASEFFSVFSSPIYDSQTPEAIYASSLLLAMTCVHELAHAVLLHRLFPQNRPLLNAGQQIEPEPLFTLADPVIELGEALEHFLIGGTLHVLGAPDDGSLDAAAELGLAWAPWVSPDPATHETWFPADAEPLFWALSAKSVSRLFDPDTWTLTHPTIELAPARALTIAVEDLEEDIYETLFLARLLAVRKGMAVPRNGQGRDLVPQGRRVLGIIIRPALDLAVQTALILDGTVDPHVLWLVS